MYLYEVSSQHNIDVLGIILSMWKIYNFETIFSYYDVLNIQYVIGKEFWSIEISLYIWFNSYFCPRRTNIPHITPNYGPGQ